MDGKKYWKKCIFAKQEIICSFESEKPQNNIINNEITFMKTVFVIGNGFDLAHGLRTSYNNFMLSLKSNDFLNNRLLKILKINNSDYWSDIEYTYFKLLGLYNDRDFIIRQLKYDSTFRSSEELDTNFETIKELLERYLIEEQQNFKPIAAYSNLFSAFDNEDTLILDFNYTNIISKYLENKNSSIKHIKIHGELGNTDNPIIFGYAANDEEAKVLSDKNDEYLMRNIKKLRYLLTDNETNFKAALGASNHNIDVYILGHSCGLSDRLILHELFTDKRVNNITPLYYGNRDSFLKSVININRIIDDYSKTERREKSFNKISNYKKSTAILQHNSSEADTNIFSSFINSIKTNHSNKKSRSFMITQ